MGLDAFRRSGENDVAGVERIEGRRHLDQLGDAQDEVARVGALAGFAVDGEGETERARVGDFVGGASEPGAEDGIGIRRFAEATILGAAGW